MFLGKPTSRKESLHFDFGCASLLLPRQGDRQGTGTRRGLRERARKEAPIRGVHRISDRRCAALVLALAFLAVSRARPPPRRGSLGPSNLLDRRELDSPRDRQRLGRQRLRRRHAGQADRKIRLGRQSGPVRRQRLLHRRQQAGRHSGGSFPEFISYFNLGIAVDNSGGPNDGDIYLTFENENESRTFVYAASGIYLGRLGPIGGYRCASAVNPGDGSVVIGQEYSGGPLRYPQPDPEFLEGATSEGEFAYWGCAIAVDASGALYTGGGGHGAQIAKYPASQFGVSSPTPSVVFENESGATGLALDPTNGDLYADKGDQIVRWNAAGVQQGSRFGQLSDSRGVTVDGSRNVSATDSGGGVFVFGPNEVQLPKGSTGGSSNVTATGGRRRRQRRPRRRRQHRRLRVPLRRGHRLLRWFGPLRAGGPARRPGRGQRPHRRPDLGDDLPLPALPDQRQRHADGNGRPDLRDSARDRRRHDSARDRSEKGPGHAARLLHRRRTGSPLLLRMGQDQRLRPDDSRPPRCFRRRPGPGVKTVAPIQISGLAASITYHYRLVVSTASGVTRGPDQTFTTPTAVENLTAKKPTGGQRIHRRAARQLHRRRNLRNALLLRMGSDRRLWEQSPRPARKHGRPRER